MQRSSESIGAIAAALAKAQVELTNPEKSLVATDLDAPDLPGLRPDGGTAGPSSPEKPNGHA